MEIVPLVEELAQVYALVLVVVLVAVVQVNVLDV